VSIYDAKKIRFNFFLKFNQKFHVTSVDRNEETNRLFEERKIELIKLPNALENPVQYFKENSELAKRINFVKNKRFYPTVDGEKIDVKTLSMEIQTYFQNLLNLAITDSENLKLNKTSEKLEIILDDFSSTASAKDFYDKFFEDWLTDHPEFTKESNPYRVKQLFIEKELREEFPSVKFVSDERIKGGSSYRRPDLLIDRKTHFVIVEIDENQHPQSKERIDQIQRDLGGSPLVLIRFNPDAYTGGGETFPEAILTESGKVVPNGSEWAERFEILSQTLDKYLFTPPKNRKVVSLFFNS